MKSFIKNTYSNPFLIGIMLIIITSAFSLSGCSRELEGSLHEGTKHNLDREKNSPGISFLGAEIIPIKIGEQEEFNKAAGWLSDSEILYISNNGESVSFLYSYNLISGKEKLLFKSEKPINTVEASPEKDRILIHSAVSDEGVLTVIDRSGKELYSVGIKSYELTFEWNPFDDNLLIVSAFTKEWDFSTYLLDLRKNNLEKLQLPEPFLRWVSKDELVYQDWNDEAIALQAPLMKISLTKTEPETLFEEVYQFDTIGKYLLTVKSGREENPDLGLYTLYNADGDRVSSFTAPLLTSYSGWVVPFYDLIEKGKDFIYLRAAEHGEADIYEGGFNLIRYQLDLKEEELVFSELANEPLSCSPSGGMCLYGYQLEKVLNMETKEIIEIVQ